MTPFVYKGFFSTNSDDLYECILQNNDEKLINCNANEKPDLHVYLIATTDVDQLVTLWLIAVIDRTVLCPTE